MDIWEGKDCAIWFFQARWERETAGVHRGIMASHLLRMEKIRVQFSALDTFLRRNENYNDFIIIKEEYARA
jgi:hypothetical protein